MGSRWCQTGEGQERTVDADVGVLWVGRPEGVRDDALVVARVLVRHVLYVKAAREHHHIVVTDTLKVLHKLCWQHLHGRKGVGQCQILDLSVMWLVA